MKISIYTFFNENYLILKFSTVNYHVLYNNRFDMIPSPFLQFLNAFLPYLGRKIARKTKLRRINYNSFFFINLRIYVKRNLELKLLLGIYCVSPFFPVSPHFPSIWDFTKNTFPHWKIVLAKNGKRHEEGRTNSDRTKLVFFKLFI